MRQHRTSSPSTASEIRHVRKLSDASAEDISSFTENRTVDPEMSDRQILKQILFFQQAMLPHPIESLSDPLVLSKIEGIFLKEYRVSKRNLFNEKFRPLFIEVRCHIDDDGQETEDVFYINNFEFQIDEMEYDITEVMMLEETSCMNAIFDLFHDEYSSVPANVLFYFLLTIIIASMSTTVLSSIESLKAYRPIFEFVEIFVTITLTIEYILRVLVVRNKVAYILQFERVIDMLAILPWYITIISGVIFPFNSCIRVVRMLRLSKHSFIGDPYTDILMESLYSMLVNSGPALFLLVSVFCIFFGSLMYEIELFSDAPANEFKNVPIAMWYVLVTMSTVGYGDVVPSSSFAYLMGAFIIFLGMLMAASLIMILGEYYVKSIQSYENQKNKIKRLLLNHIDPMHLKGTIEAAPIDELYHLICTELEGHCEFKDVQIHQKQSKELVKKLGKNRRGEDEELQSSLVADMSDLRFSKVFDAQD